MYVCILYIDPYIGTHVYTCIFQITFFPALKQSIHTLDEIC